MGNAALSLAFGRFTAPQLAKVTKEIEQKGYSQTLVDATTAAFTDLYGHSIRNGGYAAILLGPNSDADPLGVDEVLDYFGYYAHNFEGLQMGKDGKPGEISTRFRRSLSGNVSLVASGQENDIGEDLFFVFVGLSDQLYQNGKPMLVTASQLSNIGKETAHRRFWQQQMLNGAEYRHSQSKLSFDERQP
jgi:hypothetical protein